jgi:Carboxypeptidase regulatory-like domain
MSVLRKTLWFVIGAASLFLLPSSAFAQATLAGVAKDASGAVLPGVTVEAASAALIEKTRTAITDGTGQYQIVDLRPGSYTVTFTLAGFSAVRREGVEISGGGTITINADMKVGNVTETVQVTGEVPVVDIQSSKRQAVLENKVINELPVARGYGSILAAIPTLQGAGANSSSSVNPSFFTAHGGPGNEGTVQVDGLNVGAAFNGGGVSGNAYDVANAQEMQISISGNLGDAETGGPILNIVPQTGGNQFKGTIFGTGAGRWAQGHNVDDALRAQGVTEAAGLIKLWDVSGAMGGPIKRDKLWFFANVRDFGNHTDIAGGFANAFAGDASHWDYAPADGQGGRPLVKSRTATSKTVISGRFTSQVTPRNKVGFSYDYQWDCDQGGMNKTDGCRPRGDDWVPGTVFGNAFSPEGFTNYWDAREVISEATWSSPVTNKLLLEAGYATFVSHWGWMRQPGALTNLVQVTSIVPVFRVYRGVDNIIDNTQNPNTWRASATYVTGAHNMKFGYRGAYHVEQTTDLSNDAGYTITDLSFVAPGFASATMRIAPWQQSNRTQYHAFYAQDQWTHNRLTLQGAVRFDRAWSWFPAEHNGAPAAGVWNTAPITFQETKGVTGYNDISPRMGLTYDVFGNGKTSLRINAGKYLQSANNQENYTVSNPALDGRNGRRGPNFQTTASRTFIDFNGNHVPDCNMKLNAPNGECILADLGNFANTNALTIINPAVLSGWGVRPYDWQFGVSVQQEIAPRTSLEVGWARRQFSNFFVYDNINISASDFTLTNLTVPNNPKLPNAGSQVQYYILNAAAANRPIQNRFTFADDYGDWTNHWSGVDITVNSRLRQGLNLQIGSSTGRAIVDNCGVVAKVPEMLNTALTNPQAFGPAYQLAGSCRKEESWQTQVRGFASYIIPKAEVLVSGIFRFQPNSMFGVGATPEGNSTGLSANYATTLNGAAATVNLLPPGQYFADRINQVDARFGKIVKFGRTSTNIAVDLLNLFNANTGTAFQLNYGDGSTYRNPTAILTPRFVRFNVTVDF